MQVATLKLSPTAANSMWANSPLVDYTLVAMLSSMNHPALNTADVDADAAIAN